MNSKNSTDIQKTSSIGLSLFGGLGVYLATANYLGVSRLPALLIAMAVTVVLLFVYIRILKAVSFSSLGYWLILPLIAVVMLISLNYSGLIYLWRDMSVNAMPFVLYSLVAVSLLILVGWKGVHGVLRACPLIAVVIIITIVFDTVFVLQKADPQLLIPHTTHSLADIFNGAGEMGVFLLAPALIFLLGFALHPELKGTALRPRDWAVGLIFPLLYLLLELLRSLVLFGELIAFDQYPILRALKSIDFGVGVSRLEFFGVIALSSGILIALMLEFSVLVDMSRLVFSFSARRQKATVVILALAIVAVSSGVYLWGGEQSIFLLGTAALAVLLLYPLLLLAQKKLRIWGKAR